MRISPAQILSGDIIVQGKVSSLAVGRQVVATVLSTPKDGLVMVSMFGRRFLVETTLDLFKDQVLNLRVHATTPRVILKPVATNSEAKAAVKILDGLVEQLVGKFGETPVASFDLKEIVRMLLRESANDPSAMQYVARLVEDYSQLPQGTLAYLLIPFVDDEGRGSARVTIAREGEDYRLHFDVMTDVLGVVESTVLRTAGGVSVEMFTASEDVVAFLRERVHELALSLERMGVTTIDVAYRKPRSPQRMNVDVLV